MIRQAVEQLSCMEYSYDGQTYEYVHFVEIEKRENVYCCTLFLLTERMYKLCEFETSLEDLTNFLEDKTDVFEKALLNCPRSQTTSEKYHVDIANLRLGTLKIIGEIIQIDVERMIENARLRMKSK